MLRRVACSCASTSSPLSASTSTNLEMTSSSLSPPGPWRRGRRRRRRRRRRRGRWGWHRRGPRRVRGQLWRRRWRRGWRRGRLLVVASGAQPPPAHPHQTALALGPGRHPGRGRSSGKSAGLRAARARRATPASARATASCWSSSGWGGRRRGSSAAAAVVVIVVVVVAVVGFGVVLTRPAQVLRPRAARVTAMAARVTAMAARVTAAAYTPLRRGAHCPTARHRRHGATMASAPPLATESSWPPGRWVCHRAARRRAAPQWCAAQRDGSRGRLCSGARRSW